jgi:hypothetical protein
VVCGGQQEIPESSAPSDPSLPSVFQENNHDQNNQEFLDFLNLADAQIRSFFEKQPRRRGTSIKRAA